MGMLGGTAVKGTEEANTQGTAGKTTCQERSSALGHREEGLGASVLKKGSDPGPQPLAASGLLPAIRYVGRSRSRDMGKVLISQESSSGSHSAVISHVLNQPSII